MTVHTFSQHPLLPARAQIDSHALDALLDSIQPDEWLHTVLRGPIMLGLLATAGALLVHVATVLGPFLRGQEPSNTVLWIVTVWGTLVIYVFVEMHRLHQARVQID